jgi:hypothetical protein
VAVKQAFFKAVLANLGSRADAAAENVFVMLDTVSLADLSVASGRPSTRLASGGRAPDAEMPPSGHCSLLRLLRVPRSTSAATVATAGVGSAGVSCCPLPSRSTKPGPFR